MELKDRLNAEDLKRTKAWLNSPRQDPLLLRLYEGEEDELAGAGPLPTLMLIYPLPDRVSAPSDAVAFAKPSSVSLDETLESLFEESFKVTAKKIAVLRRLVMGEKAPQIAEALGVKAETVHSHIKNLGQKLGVSTQIEILATVRAVESGLESSKRQPVALGGNLLDLGDGQHLEFATYGPEAGQPVLYVHGFLAGRNLPQTIEPMLAEHQIRLIALNRPGVGRSSLTSDQTQEHLDHSLRAMAHLMEHFGALYMPVITDGSGLIYALEFARQYPGRCTQILALDPTPPVLNEADLDQYIGLFHKGMVANFSSRQILQTVLQLAYEDAKALKDADAFVDWHFFRQEDGKMASPSRNDVEARWQNLQENLVNRFQHLIFDADLIKTDFVTFPGGSNLRPPITLFQTEDSAYLRPDAVGEFADQLSAPLIEAGPTLPYIEGQMAKILSAIRA